MVSSTSNQVKAKQCEWEEAKNKYGRIKKHLVIEHDYIEHPYIFGELIKQYFFPYSPSLR